MSPGLNVVGASVRIVEDWNSSPPRRAWMGTPNDIRLRWLHHASSGQRAGETHHHRSVMGYVSRVCLLAPHKATIPSAERCLISDGPKEMVWNGHLPARWPALAMPHCTKSPRYVSARYRVLFARYAVPFPPFRACTLALIDCGRCVSFIPCRTGSAGLIQSLDMMAQVNIEQRLTYSVLCTS